MPDHSFPSRPPAARPRSAAEADLRSLPLEPQHERPWFYFDRDHYVAQCLENNVSPPIGAVEAYREHYITRGAAAGLSPNPLFDEDFYRRQYPAIARDIALGKWRSGFEHFASLGAVEGLRPAWFFDGTFYRIIHPDLTDENMRFGGFSDRYTHYLLVGIEEGRAAHWTVQAAQVIRGRSDFPTDVSGLLDLLRDESKLPQILAPAFDYEWMREKYSWGGAVTGQTFLRRYLLSVRAEKLSPSPYFDEAFYLQAHPEVQEAVEAGLFSSGYQHFVQHGIKEWRRPFAAFDPLFYRDTNMHPNERSGASDQPPFVHFLRNRKKARLAICEPAAKLDIPEVMGKGIYERRCAINAGRLRDLPLRPVAHPDISVVIVVRNNYAQTVNCIASVCYGTRASLEVIVFDNGSTDETRDMSARNKGVKYLRADENLGFTVAVNRAVEHAAGRVVILLNNDTEVAPGALDLAVEGLDRDPTIGAIGGKIVRMHGRLQEAGSIIWRDGSCLGYARDDDPLDGRVNFPLDVDFCSGCFLAVTRACWTEMGGFDEAYAPAYYEESDFCVRLWERGLRVVYDPRIVVWHFEFGSSAIREEPLALMRRNQRYFVKKHSKFLSRCLPPAAARIEAARLRHAGTPRILFVEDHAPVATKGMGFARSAGIPQIFAKLGGFVSILGLHDSQWTPCSATTTRMEVLNGVNVLNVEKFFAARIGVYDTIWLSRTHNLAHLAEWRRACPEFFQNARVVLDTEAIAASRRDSYARLAGQSADLERLVMQELEHVDLVDQVCVVNEADRALVKGVLAQRGLAIAVEVLGHALALQEPPCFEATSDIVLTGSFAQLDSPNADGLLWFDRSIRPLLGESEGLDIVIAGSAAQSFANAAKLLHHYRIVDSPADMGEVYRTARAVIAPTRFAAGIPFKVHEAASYGVPVVMTDLLARQLAWENESLAVATLDAQSFATEINKVARDAAAWKRCQRKQRELVARDCDPSAFEAVVARILQLNPKEETKLGRHEHAKAAARPRPDTSLRQRPGR